MGASMTDWEHHKQGARYQEIQRRKQRDSATGEGMESGTIRVPPVTVEEARQADQDRATGEQNARPKAPILLILATEILRLYRDLERASDINKAMRIVAERHGLVDEAHAEIQAIVSERKSAAQPGGNAAPGVISGEIG
jgi:hypothetical protein